MRQFIFTKTEQFNIDSIEPKIDKIRDAFDRYLDAYPVKTPRSKHGLMGPVGKILQEVKGGKWDATSLMGYALNIHLSNPKARMISEDARSALEQGITDLISLMKEIPVNACDRVLDRIDYGLYYMRRKKGLAWLETIKNDWVDFLRQRYKDGQKLSEVWQEKLEKIGNNFEKIGYPSKKTFGDAKDQKRKDMEEFIKQAQLKGYDFEEED
ncbi:MAG: hypothetical protein PVG39_04455 [Desulfobacteraceae bacterium]